MSEYGQCSWYGPECHGNKTANGETFDMNAMTAAHKTLPFNTRIRVTNNDNNQTVDVRINDRGPFAAGRILDLSKAAFARVENVDRGLFNGSYVIIG
jgi:rare lipoprotein A